MILFVFEGKETEPLLYKTMKHLFLPKEKDDIIFCYGSNIYSLYSKMKENGYFSNAQSDVSLIPLLQEQLKRQEYDDHPLLKITNWDVISEIFLFFDYDCQETDEHCALEKNNNRIRELLDFFCDETEAGKLYINYPMVEGIRYTKKLPDSNFNTYTVALGDCDGKIFKKKVHDFSEYRSFNFLTLNYCSLLKKPSNPSLKRIRIRSFLKQRKERKKNWLLIINQNIEKALIILDINCEMIFKKPPILQEDLFNAQLTKFVSHDEVSIICSIPLFLYDYIHIDSWYKATV